MRNLKTLTAKIYEKQHLMYRDKDLYERFLTMSLKPEFFGIPKKDFKNKVLLDAGCGSTGYITEAMQKLGCKEVTHLDLGDTWIQELQTKFKMRNIEIPSKFVNGDICKMPFNDQSFDIVMANGVLMHLKSRKQAEIALSELYRVLKTGGTGFVYIGIDEAGIIDRYIAPAFRKAYKDNSDFKNYIDDLEINSLHAEINRIFKSGFKNDYLLTRNLLNKFLKFVTLDSITFFQNALQVPVNQGVRLDYEWCKKEMNKLKATEIRIVPEKYWIRKDFRRFLAPLHFNRGEKLSRILYGGGT